MSNILDVEKMMIKFQLKDLIKVTPHHIKDEDAAHRLKALQEELDELAEAYALRDLPKISDALVDLVIFALGTAVLHDLPWNDLFDEVMRANNNKTPGNPGKNRNVLNGPVDLIKPDGWKPPDIEGVLRDWGWKE